MWSCPPASAGLGQRRSYSTQEAEKLPEEEPLHNIINDTESVQGGAATAAVGFYLFIFYKISSLNGVPSFPCAGSSSQHEFQAETKKLLDIVARSLYSEKEVRVCGCV